MNDVVNAIEMHGSGPPPVTVSFHGLPLKTNKIMASTVKRERNLKWKIGSNGRRKREGEMLCISGGKVLQQVTLLPRVASRQAKLGVISGLWGDLASRVQGATV
jgi:hypothetical protein